MQWLCPHRLMISTAGSCWSGSMTEASNWRSSLSSYRASCSSSTSCQHSSGDESAMPRKYKLGPDVKPEEKIYDSKGNLIDENYIERAVEDVHRQLGRGRPSLTAPGRISPEIKARVPVELKDRLQQAAKEHGKPLSVFIREALEQYLDEAS